jgi:transcription elongation factor Elf1
MTKTNQTDNAADCPSCGNKITVNLAKWKGSFKAIMACHGCEMAEHPETGKWTFFVGGFKPLREGGAK